MSQDTENFEQLRRLLALKRYEQPPPGYFNDFSRQVIVRIQTGDLGHEANLLERLFVEAPWIQRLWQALEARPLMAGACGVAICGLMLTGVLYSDRAEVTPVALVPVAESGPAPLALNSASAPDQPFVTDPVALVQPGTPRPILTASPGDGSLLGDLKQLKAERVSFPVPAGN
jgi:hypothetical protein